MITLDTSGLVALLDQREHDHVRCREILRDDPGPYLVPVGILAEVTYFIERRFGLHVLELFLSDIETGAYT